MSLHQYSKNASWTAFSPAGTGWSSFTNNDGLYVVLGETCYVIFRVLGTSNSVDALITLPLPAISFGNYIIRVGDNIGSYRDGLLEITGNTAPTTTGTCFPTPAGVFSAWTASGAKEVVGCCEYQVT